MNDCSEGLITKSALLLYHAKNRLLPHRLLDHHNVLGYEAISKQIELEHETDEGGSPTAISIMSLMAILRQ